MRATRSQTPMTELERDQLVLHAAFLLAAAVALAVPVGPSLGWRVALLVLVYHAATVVVARQGRHRTWLRLWWFAAVVSVFQVLPDAFLVEGLGVLEFPDDGFPDLGPVSAHMAAMWTVPIVMIVAVADAAGRRLGERASWTAALLTAAVVFVGAEAILTRVGIWEPVEVSTLLGVALYIVPAEVLLGVAVLAGARWTRDGPLLRTVPVALVISLLYTGAAAVSWLVVERGLLG
jgi:hypothetical protein